MGLFEEMYAQKNLMNAQIEASTVLANAFGKQMCDFRREVCAELSRSDEKCVRPQNEQSNAEHKEHAQTLGNLVIDVEQLKATMADRFELVNKPDDVNSEAFREFWSAIEDLRENMDLIAGDMTMTSDKMIAKCKEQCTQCIGDFKVDVEQLRSEAKKCNEQCINNTICCLETRDLVERCERGIAFAALEFQEQRDKLFSNVENLKLANLSQAEDGKPSPAGTSETESSGFSHLSPTDESWYIDDLMDDDTSENEIKGLRRQQMVVNQKLLALNTELKSLRL